MKFNVLTIFPDMIHHYTDEAILGRAQKAGIFSVNAIDLRDFTDDRRRTVDDTPYGGGAGMIMKPEPIFRALKSIDAIPFRKDSGITKIKKLFNGDIRKKKITILLSPRGRQFDQRTAEKWSRYDEINFVCGRYEGVDERVVENMIDEEISIGPYVLAGGELGVLVMIEAVARLLPGVLGNSESLAEETFGNEIKSKNLENKTETEMVGSEYAQYTKPVDFNGSKVPEVLLSGDHKKIREWRRQNQLKKSR